MICGWKPLTSSSGDTRGVSGISRDGKGCDSSKATHLGGLCQSGCCLGHRSLGCSSSEPSSSSYVDTHAEVFYYDLSVIMNTWQKWWIEPYMSREPCLLNHYRIEFSFSVWCNNHQRAVERQLSLFLETGEFHDWNKDWLFISRSPPCLQEIHLLFKIQY